MRTATSQVLSRFYLPTAGGRATAGAAGMIGSAMGDGNVLGKRPTGGTI